MDAGVKERWIDALLSGEYSQSKDVLRSETGYCCLGVLCDILKEEVNGEWAMTDEGFRFDIPDDVDAAYALPPDTIVEYAGMTSENPTFELGSGRRTSLAEFNDAGHSFVEIAAIIKEKL